MKYLILGSGVAGLTFANLLKKRGEDSFLVLEKNNEAGGLCRSAYSVGGGGYHSHRYWRRAFFRRSSSAGHEISFRVYAGERVE
ncbi:MAG: NAD(P)-binding protein [Selenomonadaceae bacterium]|nr:NAD(P)-binding protein [Selenomonadaceae bacterium]